METIDIAKCPNCAFDNEIRGEAEIKCRHCGLLFKSTPICLHCEQELVLDSQEEDYDFDDFSYANLMPVRAIIRDVYVQVDGKPCKTGCGHYPKNRRVYH